MRLQHNIMAKSAYRSYRKNVSGMKKNLERLSSGYKINRSADDAAGLAISEKMRAQITGEETAQKNARDGISLVQTAEGALAEVHDMLDRMVELATQSANGTYDNDTDRLQLQKEMDQLLGEIDRIAESANFNGIPLLDGSMDAGGAVYAPGPAGSIELPDVGKTQGENTVLHTDSATDGRNVFSVGLHSIILNANSSISIAIGDNITITVTNNSNEAVTAEDIAAAIAGNSNKNISVDYGDAKPGTSEDGNVTVTLNGKSVFELKNSGSDLIFTQTGGSNIGMSQEVSIADVTPPPPEVEGSGSIDKTEPDESGHAQYTFDLSGVTMTAPGNVTVEIFGQQFELKISDDEFNGGNVGRVLAEKLANALNAADLVPDEPAGSLSFTDNSDGTITLVFGNAGEVPGSYADKLSKDIIVSASSYQDGATGTAYGELIPGPPSGAGGVQSQASASVKIGDETFHFDVYTPPYPNIDSSKDNVIFAESLSDYGNKIKEKLIQIFAQRNAENREKHKNYDEYVNIDIKFDKETNDYTIVYEYVKKRYIGFSDGSGGDGGTGGSGGADVPAENFSGEYDHTTTVLQKKQTANDHLASTVIELKPDMMANGAGIIIGGKEYTFTTDKTNTNKITANKDNLVYVGDLDLNTKDGLKSAIARLTVVAADNGVWSVGYGGDGGKITLREKVKDGSSYMDENGADAEFDLTTPDGIKASLGWRAPAPEAKNGHALTLQIGDTFDSSNQLQVSIRDCRPVALGIAHIRIADQESAQAAVNVIRAAVNYVSDVRGSLGAAQNRLDHTINNLSVMAENIQDAESTIRDADVAEEMMAYTKNNILIQSSQAMLAQANQVPQGVLQMLQ